MEGVLKGSAAAQNGDGEPAPPQATQCRLVRPRKDQPPNNDPPDSNTKRPRLRVSRPTQVVLADSLLAVRVDLIRLLITAISGRGWNVKEVWRVVMEVAVTLTQAEYEEGLKAVAGYIGNAVVPHLTCVTTLSTRLERTKLVIHNKNLIAALAARLPLVPPAPPTSGFSEVITRFIKLYRLVTITFLVSPNAEPFQLPNIRGTISAIPRVKVLDLSPTAGRFDEIRLRKTRYVTGYLVSAMWKWARRDLGLHALLAISFHSSFSFVTHSKCSSPATTSSFAKFGTRIAVPYYTQSLPSCATSSGLSWPWMRCSHSKASTCSPRIGRVRGFGSYWRRIGTGSLARAPVGHQSRRPFPE